MDKIVPEILYGNFQLIVGNNLILEGPGVIDEVIACVNGLTDLNQVTLEGTGLTPRGLRAFSGCQNLKEFTTRDNPDFRSSDVESMIRRSPTSRPVAVNVILRA